MADEVRIALVGVGRIGLTHAENLARRVYGARLVAVTTANAERAAEAHRVCGDVAVYPELEALLAGIAASARLEVRRERPGRVVVIGRP